MDRKSKHFPPRRKRNKHERKLKMKYTTVRRRVISKTKMKKKLSLYSFKKSFFIMIFFLDREWVRERKVRTKPTKLAKTERKAGKSAEMRTSSPNAKPNYAPFFGALWKENIHHSAESRTEKRGKGKGRIPLQLPGLFPFPLRLPLLTPPPPCRVILRTNCLRPILHENTAKTAWGKRESESGE